MKVKLKGTFDAEQFNPKRGVPKGVIDLLRTSGLKQLKDHGFEWGIATPSGDFVGINIGDWVLNNDGVITTHTNEVFRRNFEEVSE